MAIFRKGNKFLEWYWQYFNADILLHAANRAIEKNSWQTTGCNKDWLKILFWHFLPLFRNGNDFLSGYLNFDVLNNNTFFGAIQKTDEK